VEKVSTAQQRVNKIAEQKKTFAYEKATLLAEFK
jgi:hypothetical protein